MRESLHAAGLILLAGTAAAQSSVDTEGVDSKTTEDRLADLEAEVARLQAAQDAPDGTVSGKFEQGKLKFTTADGDFTLQLGGRVQVDFGHVSQDDAWKTTIGDEDDRAEVRRARMYMQGDMYRKYEYKWQVDFAGAEVRLKDFYLAAKDIGIGRLAAGQMKEPFGLEWMTSSNNISTMERSSMNALVPNRSVGAMLSDTLASERVAWFLGAFKDDGSDTANSIGTGATDITARLAGTLLNRNGGRQLVHLGLQFKGQQANMGTLQYRSRGPTHIPVNYAVDTAGMAANNALVYGAEAAWVQGPFSLQGEFTISNVDVDTGSDPTFTGWYALASYVLTGESRPYKPVTASFSGVTPAKDGGAWELVGRVGQLDLEDEAIAGGKLDSYTLGVNWYVNRNQRVMLNWIHMDVSGVGRAGIEDVLAVRWQLAF